MSDEKLPDPLVPQEVDISKLDGFMLDTVRLLGSELVALSTGEEFKAAVLLWCRAWKQTPACSLPADDRILASFAMVPLNRWSKVKGMALRGFVTCSDGRLYHKVLAADGLRAWEALTKRRDRTKAATEARMKASQNERDERRYEQRNVDRDDQRYEAPTVARDGTGRDGTERKKSSAQHVPSSLPRENAEIDATAPRSLQGAKDGQPATGQRATAKSKLAGHLRPANDPSVADRALGHRPKESAAPLVSQQATEIIVAFDRACKTAWPDNPRPYPAATDAVIAGKWAEAGADPSLVEAVATAVFSKRAAKSRACPTSLGYLDGPVAEALEAKRNGSAPGGNGVKPAGYRSPFTDAEREAMRREDAAIEAAKAGGAS